MPTTPMTNRVIPRRDRWSLGTYNFVFAATITLGILIVAEVVLRADIFTVGESYGIFQLTHNLRETGLFRLTGEYDLPYVMHPNYTYDFRWGAKRTTNANGFYGDVLSDEDDTGILVVGDSVAWGLGLKEGEAFSDRLKSLLQENHPSIRIANASAPGYNTLHEATLFREVSDRSATGDLAFGYRPRLVILQFNDNDFLEIDEVRRANNRYYFYARVSTKTIGEARGLYRYSLDHSMLFFRLNRLVAGLLEGQADLHDYPNWTKRVYDRLVSVRDYADQQGFTVLFLNYGYRDDAVRYDKISSFNSIFDYYVDLRDEFEAMREMPVWYDAIHPNAAGHKFIAERLYQYIETNMLLQSH